MKKLDLDNLLQSGITAHKRGDFEEADGYYTRILKIDASHPDANHNLGLIALRFGKGADAVRLFERAISSNSSIEQYWVSLIDALFALRRFKDVEIYLESAKDHKILGHKIDEYFLKLGEAVGLQASEDQKKTEGDKFSFDIDTLSLPENLRLAKKLVNQNRFTEAQKIYKEILKKFPANKKALKALKALDNYKIASGAANPASELLQALIDKFSDREFKQVIEDINNLQSYYPGSYKLLNLLGTTHSALGEFDRAVKSYEKAISINPNLGVLHFNLGNAFRELGNNIKAITSYERALNLSPDLKDGYLNISILLRKEGQSSKAVKYCQKGIELAPEFLELYNVLGNAQTDLGNYDSAITTYKNALTIDSKFYQAWSNMGNALMKLGLAEKAEAAYRNALKLAPQLPQIQCNYGNAQAANGKLNDAVRSYKEAIRLNTDYLEAYANLCDVYEQWNKLDELRAWIQHCKSVFKFLPADLVFYDLILHFRTNDYKGCEEILNTLDFSALSASKHIRYMETRAKIYDKLSDYDNAFTCFQKMNQLAAKLPEYSVKAADDYLVTAVKIYETLKNTELKKNVFLNPHDNAPVFLVGFPRSGTTLMDSVLRSHSAIEVVEEQPMLQAAKKSSKLDINYDFIRMFPSDEEGNNLRQNYLDRLDSHAVPNNGSKVIIDKLPLNISELPLISYLFPNAKVIVAIRHPLDVILSNWMQNFELNAAMSNMVSIDRIVKLYKHIMGIVRISEHFLPLEMHFIRYENLIENFNDEVGKLLQFLELDWEDGVTKFYKTAAERGKINTPSYTQVVKPLYHSSKFKWKNYESHFSPYFCELEEIAGYLNYNFEI